MHHPDPLRVNTNGAHAEIQEESSPDKRPLSAGDGVEESLIERIHAEHCAVVEAGRSVVEHASNAGEMLIEAQKALRKAIGWGHWGAWLRDNFDASESTANNYMRLASNREDLERYIEENPERAGDLSLRGALKLIAELEASGDEPDDESQEKTPTKSKRGGAKKKGPGKSGRCDPPEPVIYGASSLPVPRTGLETTLDEDRAAVLRIDAPAEAERALEAIKSFLEETVRAAWEAGHDVRLAVLCARDVLGLAKGCDVAGRELAEEADGEEASEEQIEKYERGVIREAKKERDDRSLYQIIIEQGGIKPPSENGSVEEYKEIPNCYKRKNGLAGDEMADYLGAYHPQFGIYRENDLIEYFARRRRGRAA